MRFLTSVTVPKNVKGRTLWDFLTSILLQNIKTNEGGPFGAIEKFSKKPKKILSEKHQDSQRGILSMFDVFVVLDVGFVSLCFGRGSEVVEQMIKKVELTRLKKLHTVRVGHFFSKAPTKNAF